jgi:hypothetical protein
MLFFYYYLTFLLCSQFIVNENRHVSKQASRNVEKSRTYLPNGLPVWGPFGDYVIAKIALRSSVDSIRYLLPSTSSLRL